MSKIGFIGAGNMARSIIGGLLASGSSRNDIWATVRSEEKRSTLENAFSVNVTLDNVEAVKACRIIVLAVKPQMMFGVCEEIAPYSKGKLIISVAAGISCESLERWLGTGTAIVRCMPNTPALIRKGATGMFANKHVALLQRQAAEAVMHATGEIYWVSDEDLMHAVTAMSGSGPAYFFLFLEAMTEAGIKQGLSASVAKALAIQTAQGAAALAKQSEETLAELRRKVTSPGGTTEQAILSFERDGLRDSVDAAIRACAERSKELSKELS